MGEWRYSSTILNLGSRWKSVVSFTTLPLYLRCPLDWRLGGSQSRCGHWRKEKYLSPAGNRTPAVRPVAIPTAIPAAFYTTYEGQSVNIARKIYDIRTWGKRHLFRDISSTNINTLALSLYQCVETRFVEIL
jgi:hypothetical protein